MRKRNAYHSSLKIAVALKLTNGIPIEFLKTIPSSTLYEWKSLRKEELVGFEYSNVLNQNFEDTNTFYSSTMQYEKRVFLFIARVKVFLLGLFSKKEFQQLLHNNLEHTVNFIERVQGVMSIKNCTRLLGVSTDTFYHWRTKVKFKCDSSALLLCVKRHPNQATMNEIKIIKQYLTNLEYSHWGIYNIWAYAFKNSATRLSINSWYHYNKVLGIRTKRKVGKKPKYTPILATKVNEIWHLDISKFKTKDHIEHCIYTLKDNFSKKILAWYIHDRVDGKITTLLIKKACANAFNTVDTGSLKLITDGGPENTSLSVKEFINNSQTDIEHLIALKDIKQSNSMMESFYRGLKSMFLYHKNIENLKQLFKYLAFFIDDYNNKRPHSSLGICTPNEVYKGLQPTKPSRDTYVLAAQKRREENKKQACKRCS